MLLVDGVTYRIDRFAAEYRIVRVKDDAVIGCFCGTAPTIQLHCTDVDEPVARAVAREALRTGRTIWRPDPRRNGAETRGLLALAHWVGFWAQPRRS